MNIKRVSWISSRRADVEIEEGDSFVTFTEKITKGVYKIFFQGIPHILYDKNGEWQMIEEEVYEL